MNLERYPNIVALPNVSSIDPMYGCVVCHQTWSIPMFIHLRGSDAFHDRLIELCDKHRHNPEPVDDEPLDPSGVPRCKETT
jgi:hypothetical protein